MKQYIAIHHHKFGTTPYLFQSERDIFIDSAEEIAKVLGIDYEPENEEELEIHLIEKEENPII